MRRPFSSTSVRIEVRPCSETVEMPPVVAPEAELAVERARARCDADRLQQLLDVGRAALLDLVARDHLHRQRRLGVDALDRGAGDLDAPGFLRQRGQQGQCRGCGDAGALHDGLRPRGCGSAQSRKEGKRGAKRCVAAASRRATARGRCDAGPSPRGHGDMASRRKRRERIGINPRRGRSVAAVRQKRPEGPAAILPLYHHGTRMTKFVFVTGGVVSSLGKGIAAASLAAILESRGLKVTLHQARSVPQRRSGHDVARSSTARCSSPTTAPRPTSTSATTSASSRRG